MKYAPPQLYTLTTLCETKWRELPIRVVSVVLQVAMFDDGHHTLALLCNRSLMKSRTESASWYTGEMTRIFSVFAEKMELDASFVKINELGNMEMHISMQDIILIKMSGLYTFRK